MKIIISDVKEGSIAHQLNLSQGDEIISINNTAPRDIIDYSFLVKDEEFLEHILHDTPH